MKQIFQSQLCVKLELQEDRWKMYRYVEIQHHAPEQPRSQRRNQRRNRKKVETNENGKTLYQNLQYAAQTISRDTYLGMNTCIKKKGDLK